MIEDCIAIFEKYAAGDPYKLILDCYTPPQGLYLIMEETKEGFLEKKRYEVKQDSKTKDINLYETERLEISRLDYFSRLIDMNKPIDGKKIIQSNNYLSFSIKIDSLYNKKLTNEIIDNYYKILMDPAIKYKKGKQDLELYQLVEEKVGPVNQEKVKKIKSWIKENIFQFADKVEGKDYLKIFFLCEGIDIKKESERYIFPNIFNKNDYNVNIEGEIYGLPNENLGLNTKKPYLENKSRKYKVPALISTKEVLLRKNFFDYLWGQACRGRYNIYFDSIKNEIIPLEARKAPENNMYGYFLRIRKEKNEAAIIDMDFIEHYKPKLKKPFYFGNILGLESIYLRQHSYGTKYQLSEILSVIDEELFSKFLVGNLYNEPKDISCNNDGALKEAILLSRSRLTKWLFLGREEGVSEVIEKVGIKLIENSISKGYMEKVQHQFNLYLSLWVYLKGGNDKMADDMIEIRAAIREKINQKQYVSVDTDEEYYYGLGQLIRYFLSLNKGNKKQHSLFNTYLTTKQDKIFKEKLKGLFIKYSYCIEQNNIRFNNLYAMINNYQPNKEINHTYLIGGYISNNLLYEKKEDLKNE